MSDEAFEHIRQHAELMDATFSRFMVDSALAIIELGQQKKKVQLPRLVLMYRVAARHPSPNRFRDVPEHSDTLTS